MDSSEYLRKLENAHISTSLDENLQTISALFANSADLLITRVILCEIPCALLCCEGMVSSQTLTEAMLEPLNTLGGRFTDAHAFLKHLHENCILSPDCKCADSLADLCKMLCSGFALLFAEGTDSALAVGIQGYPSRGISAPDSEQNIYGAKEGFTENLHTNLSLLRRRMKSPLLTMQMCTAGTISRTDLCICWLQDRVSQELVSKIKEKLENLPLETVLSGGYVRPFLEERGGHLFHSVGTTERPDVLCAKMLEGRVAVLIDGTPFALVLPQLFWELFQTLDDYNESPIYATAIRLLKFAAFLLALMLPAVYLAVAVWHPELLNRTLLEILADAEQKAPFSLSAEMLGVLFMFEVVREAGLRLPNAVGGAVSIVGGLIIGDAAVESGLVSTPVLTVTALSVTAGFVIPELHTVLALLRPTFILAGSVCGLSGISVIFTMVLCNLCAAEVFGYPTSAPFAPLRFRRLRDVFMRQGFRKLSQGNFLVSEVRQSHDTDEA